VVAGAFGGATLGERLGAFLNTVPLFGGRGEIIGFGSVIVLITYLSIVLGELIPKRIALRNPERMASIVAGPMRALSKVAAPFVWMLGTSTDALLRLLGLHGEPEVTVTEEEVRSLISEGARAGVFAPKEKEMIDGVLRLADRKVRAIMTPRPDVVWLDPADPEDTLLCQIQEGGHSRYPICRGDLDDVVGIVHTRDLPTDLVRGKPFDLLARARKPLIVHDGASILKLLELMRSSGLHLAMVVDEYGSVEGVVTVTDILESIAGDLPEAGEAPEAPAVRREDGSWLVEGWMPVDEFEDAIGIRGLRDAADFHTIAGFVLNALGHVPTAGEAFLRDGFRFEVVDMDGRRIDKILVTPPSRSGVDVA
ncbi:MAG TPA: hemolysin family protein, partial [Roseiarcus sp.]|nr:hemolysin family protein [Roseiarcus sp.]